MAYYVISSGESSNGIILNYNDSMTVYKDGTANNTTVNSRGGLTISKGGRANSTVLSSGGMTVFSGGLASTTKVNFGSMWISSGGTANNIIVKRGGLVVYGTATNIDWTPCEGVVSVMDDAYATFVSQYSGVYYGSGGQLISHAAAMESKTVSMCTVYVMSGGTANNITFNSGCQVTVSSGGTAINTIFEGVVFDVSSGGVVNNITMNSGGQFHLYSGGTATGISASHATNPFLTVAPNTVAKGTIDGSAFEINGPFVSDCSLTHVTFCLRGGGTAINTIVNSNGGIQVRSGGTANNTTVNSGGYIGVFDSGIANRISINAGGWMVVNPGGTATNIIWTPCVGSISIADGAYVTFTSQYSGVYYGSANQLLSNTTELNNIDIKSSCEMYVMSGGTANNTTINYHIGHMEVSNGGTANSTTISQGFLLVSSGGTANNTTVNGSLGIYNGGTANSTTISGGTMRINSGGIVNNTIYLRGSMSISSGGTANSTIVSGCGLEILNSGIANNTIISNGILKISSGGIANFTNVIGNDISYVYGQSVYKNSYMFVSFGGIANNTTIDSGSYFPIFSGGTADSTTINSGGRMYFISGGTATNIIINSGGKLDLLVAHGTYIQGKSAGSAFEMKNASISNYSLTSNSMEIYSGGTASITSVNDKGSMYISNGGIANITVINSEGNMIVSSGGIANNTVINSEGSMLVSSGGTANKISINNGGYLIISSGGTVNSTTVGSGASLIISSGIFIGDTIVYGNGELNVLSKSIAYGAKVYAGGTLKLSRGAMITEKMDFAAGAIIFAENGAVVDFNLTQTAAGGKALLTDWSLIQGTPDYTLTVNSNQANGVYALADGAEDFNGTISVQNALGESFGTLTIGETLSVGKAKYALKLENESLILSITGSGPADTTAPTVSNIKASTTKPTSQSVTVTATFKDNIEVAQSLYRIGETGEWMAYVDGVTVTENATIYFKAIDTSGNESQIASYTVNNIQKPAPEPEPSSNCADNGWNNWLYDAKTKTTNDAVTDSEATDINADTWEIVVDAEDVSYEDRHGNLYSNFVGYGDAVDFSRICLENAAKLSLSVMATDAAKITIWRLNETWKKGVLTYSQKSLQSTKLALNKQTGLYRADTKPLLLEAGEYYISVESTNAKKGGSAYYDVKVDQDRSVFFDRGDNTDDWTDMKRNGAFSDEYGDAGTVNEYTEYVMEDGWVGYGDTVDYARIHLDDAAKLSFSLDATDAAKFTIYKLNSKTDKKGVVSYSLKSLQSTTLKKPKNADEYTATTKALLLESGDYYIAMESTNAKKGGSADYNVSVNGRDTAFFSDADDGWNNWLYDKKTKELNEEVAYHEPVEISPYTERVQVDADAVCHEDANRTTWDNYVGYGDEFDYAKIQLESDARLSFTITATDAAKFTVYTLIEKVNSWTGIVSFKLETIQSASLKKAKGDSLYRYSVTMMIPGGINYYVSMQSTNAKKGGCAYYNVEINRNKSSFDVDYPYGVRDQLEAGDADTLSLPETDNLAKNGMLSESGNGILASL